MSKEIKIRLVELAVGSVLYFGILIGGRYDYWNLAVTKEMEPVYGCIRDTCGGHMLADSKKAQAFAAL